MDKHCGAGRDSRIASAPATDSAAGMHQLGPAMASFRPVDLTKVPAWPHSGLRAVVELLKGIHGLGLTASRYHANWGRNLLTVN